MTKVIYANVVVTWVQWSKWYIYHWYKVNWWIDYLTVDYNGCRWIIWLDDDCHSRYIPISPVPLVDPIQYPEQEV